MCRSSNVALPDPVELLSVSHVWSLATVQFTFDVILNVAVQLLSASMLSEVGEVFNTTTSASDLFHAPAAVPAKDSLHL